MSTTHTLPNGWTLRDERAVQGGRIVLAEAPDHQRLLPFATWFDGPAGTVGGRYFPTLAAATRSLHLRTVCGQ